MTSFNKSLEFIKASIKRSEVHFGATNREISTVYAECIRSCSSTTGSAVQSRRSPGKANGKSFSWIFYSGHDQQGALDNFPAETSHLIQKTIFLGRRRSLFSTHAISLIFGIKNSEDSHENFPASCHGSVAVLQNKNTKIFSSNLWQDHRGTASKFQCECHRWNLLFRNKLF